MVATAAPGARAAAITPLKEGTKATVTFSASVAAERKTADADPMGPRSHFKILRETNFTCRMIAAAPSGISPDGPTPAQQAIIDATEASSQEAFADPGTPQPGSYEALIAACGEDADCQMRTALQIANDPKLRQQAEAAEASNARKVKPAEEAIARKQAMQLEPNWQRLLPDFDRNSGKGACTGTITTDDVEVYRLGFDGGDMGEGKETRKGTSPLNETFHFEVIWYDLKTGRLVIDMQFGAIGGSVKSVNVGGRDVSRQPGIQFNEDWQASAGKISRLERADVRAVRGTWTIALPITAKENSGFVGTADARWSVTVP